MFQFQGVRPSPRLKQSEGTGIQPCSKRARYALSLASGLLTGGRWGWGRGRVWRGLPAAPLPRCDASRFIKAVNALDLSPWGEGNNPSRTLFLKQHLTGSPGHGGSPALGTPESARPRPGPAGAACAASRVQKAVPLAALGRPSCSASPLSPGPPLSFLSRLLGATPQPPATQPVDRCIL